MDITAKQSEMALADLRDYLQAPGRLIFTTCNYTPELEDEGCKVYWSFIGGRLSGSCYAGFVPLTGLLAEAVPHLTRDGDWLVEDIPTVAGHLANIAGRPELLKTVVRI